MNLYFVAGEASGDAHGAALMEALRSQVPKVNLTGRGGPRMRAIAGEPFMNWVDSAAVVGLWEVAKKYGYFREEFQRALSEIETIRPDAVVLIDYPGFNLRLARALRRKSLVRKIVYYISPQVWAWNRGRIRQMATFLDLMLCIFPFEAELYNQSGLRTVFVGHPMMENLGSRSSSIERQPDLIGLLPGSRPREIRKIFPIMIGAAGKMLQERPNLHFEVAAASEPLRAEIERMLGGVSFRHRVRVILGDTAGTMQRANAGLIASGTATLEAAYFRLPFLLLYKVSWPTYVVGRLLLNTKYLGMPNVLAGREIVPEFIQARAKAETVAKAALNLVNDPMAREKMTAEFDSVIAQLGEKGASEKAARIIVEELNEVET